MTLPETPRLDVINRTMFNLKFIEDRRGPDDGPFEVTQLVNSFLGALVHPWEDIRGEVSIHIGEAEDEGWPIPFDQKGQRIRTMRRLLTLMRNSVAHGGVSFHGNPGGEIEFVRFTNLDPDTREMVWTGSLTVGELRTFLTKFSELASAHVARASTLASSHPATVDPR